jgi:hypothetical protein
MMDENIARNIELAWNNKLIYIVHLVGYFHGWTKYIEYSRHQPAATWVNTTRYCKYSQVLLMMCENIARNMYS